MKKLGILLLSLIVFHTAGAQVIDLAGEWKFQIGDNHVWKSPKYDDGKWELIEVPAAWEDEGYHGYDGFAWYRTTFNGNELSKQSIYYVNLGFIDDADEVYLNGELIGFAGKCAPKFKTAYNTERRYPLPSHLINYDEQNVIAIRVFDGMHRGGIIDGKPGIYKITVNTRLLVDLQGIWSFTYSKNGERAGDDSDWQSILVPGPWEFQGFKYNGFAWYKRTFILPDNFNDGDLVLLLGKIDDFDKTYINGKLVGSTSDKKPFGQSGSYMEDRVYNIPKGLLVKGGSNTIEVLVHDIGNIGGIYEGVIGIIEK